MVDIMNNQPIEQKEVFGAFECVSLPLLKIKNVIAKIDTGAYSGAVHCVNIKCYVRKSDGKRVLKFSPLSNVNKPVEIEDYTVTNVRTSSGHQMKRYLIDTDIIIKNKTYKMRIGLSDRSDMDKQILIGRLFLRQNAILVDVNINKEHEKDF